MKNVNETRVWCCERGYLVEKTPELETEVQKVLQLWKESDALPGYCPHAKEAKVHEYNTPGYRVGTVTEHTGVASVSLYKLENQ